MVRGGSVLCEGGGGGGGGGGGEGCITQSKQGSVGGVLGKPSRNFLQPAFSICTRHGFLVETF